MKSLGVLSSEAESRHQFFQEPDNFLSSSLLSSQWFFIFTPQCQHGGPIQDSSSHLLGSLPLPNSKCSSLHFHSNIFSKRPSQKTKCTFPAISLGCRGWLDSISLPELVTEDIICRREMGHSKSWSQSDPWLRLTGTGRKPGNRWFPKTKSGVCDW